MKTKPFFYLFIAVMLPLMACGLLQPGLAPTQTAAAQTTVAASWTATPTETLTPTPTETATPTPTPDPCSPENLEASVDDIHQLMIRFDRRSSIAVNTPREELAGEISELQDLLELAMEQDTPPCLETLREHQLNHMNLVIDTLLAFSEGAEQDVITEGIESARREHDEYLLEYARLLEIDLPAVTATSS